MSEEKELESKQNLVEDTTTEQAPAEEITEVDVDHEDGEASTSNEEESTIDYAAELEKAQSSLKKAEHKIVDLKKANKDTSSVDESVEELRQEISNLRAEMQGLVEEKTQETQDILLRQSMTRLLGELTTDSDEAALILHHFNNTIRRSGSSEEAIKSDLRNAQAIANTPKLKRQVSEVKATLDSAKMKKTIRTSGGAQAPSEGSYNDEDMRIAQKFFGGDIKRYLKHKNNQ